MFGVFKNFRSAGVFRSIPSTTGLATRGFSISARTLNNKDDLVQSQLINAVKSKETKPNLDDSLFGILNELDQKPTQTNLYEDLGLSTMAKVNARDVAKQIRVNGVLAGRTIDIIPGAVSYGVSAINSLNRSNKIRYLQKIQSRFIRPAKYRKQLKREWWRRRFKDGFKELMAQVKDARRRGY